MKTSAIVALALATALSGSRAYAQSEQPTVHHHHHVHRHHDDVAHGPAPIPESTAAAQRPGESPQPNQMFKPYAHPGDGDNDGLSRDPDDCMKGCIGGAPQ